MAWDERTFGRAYDLDVFNVVAVSDFNMALRQSWNQSRQVTRLPDQLWKYSCAMIASMLA
jgi:aminopeptidase N